MLKHIYQEHHFIIIRKQIVAFILPNSVTGSSSPKINARHHVSQTKRKQIKFGNYLRRISTNIKFVCLPSGV